MNNDLQLRLHGSPALPTLIYLPGLHGDWTLATSFRCAVAGQVRFVEMTYPRTRTWSLDDHAQAIEEALQANGVSEGWLIGESFGSQPAWQMIRRFHERQRRGLASEGFRPLGLMLAAGFVKHPLPWGAWLLRWLAGCAPGWTVNHMMKVYAAYAKFRHRRAPETLASIDEFVTNRRHPLDREAMGHRYVLIAESDLRPVAQATHLPVYYLAGVLDPLVPFPWVRLWLRRHCPGYRGGTTLSFADHNPLGTQPDQSARLILGWMKKERDLQVASARPASRHEAMPVAG